MANTLSVRRQGAAVGNRVREDPANAQQARDAPRLLILIHGYQNSEEKAAGSFGAFLAAMWSVLPQGLGPLGAVWEFHWPGDHPFGPLSVATYGTRVPVAIAAGNRLAQRWLARRQPEQKVVIVAHSLGCRVALEAIEWIREQDEYGAAADPPNGYRGATVEAVFLLAAAVPVHLCDPDDDGYLEQPWRDSKEHAFHSRHDRALGKIFNAGEWVANEHGPAVGLAGAPAGRWSSSTPMPHLGHGDYWSSKDVAEKIGALLGLIPRPLGRRELPEDELAHDERHLAAREPGQRSLWSRVTGAA
jgi:hypothetical protein